MFTVFLLLHTAQAEPVALVRSWDEAQRWRAQASLQLPWVMWLGRVQNTEARAVEIDVDLVLDCGAGERIRASRWRLTCPITQASLVVAPTASEQGLMTPIAQELARYLSQSTVTLDVSSNGEVLAVDLQALPPISRRHNALNENLRLIVSRAVAGLDLRSSSGDDWAQIHSWRMLVPTSSSSAYAGRELHHLEDGVIHSRGRWMLDPNDLQATLVAHSAGEAEISEAGELLRHRWVVDAEFSPSSALADGSDRLRYVQRGTITALDPDRLVRMAPSGERVAQGPIPTALQQDFVLGETLR